METARRHTIFLLIAFFFGVVSVAAGSYYLATGEITVRQSGKQQNPPDAEQAVVGRIRSDDLLFYPIALGWLAVGVTSGAAAPLALITGSHAFGKAAAIGAVGVLAMGFSTVGAAYLYGADAPAKAPLPAEALAEAAAD